MRSNLIAFPILLMGESMQIMELKLMVDGLCAPGRMIHWLSYASNPHGIIFGMLGKLLLFLPSMFFLWGSISQTYQTLNTIAPYYLSVLLIRLMHQRSAKRFNKIKSPKRATEK